MNPATESEAQNLFHDILRHSPNTSSINLGICPPFTWLKSLAQINEKGGRLKNFHLGAQDVFYRQKGAYTGEVSPAMLKDLGVKYVLVGHSERRRLAKETSPIVAKKAKASQEAGLVPVIFTGEKRRTNIAQVLKQQLIPVCKQNIFAHNAILVYEPVWAISSQPDSRPATTEDVSKALKIIKQIIPNEFNKKIPILYGGSTNAQNLEQFLNMESIQGVVPGSASLKPEEFGQMIEKARSLQ